MLAMMEDKRYVYRCCLHVTRTIGCLGFSSKGDVELPRTSELAIPIDFAKAVIVFSQPQILVARAMSTSTSKGMYDSSLIRTRVSNVASCLDTTRSNDVDLPGTSKPWLATSWRHRSEWNGTDSIKENRLPVSD